LIRTTLLACAAALALCATAASAADLAGDHIKTAKGDLVIHPANHAGMVLSWGGKIIYVDPVGAMYYQGLPAPDLILLTDIHGDHMDPATLNGLGGSAPIVAPQAVKDMLPPALQARVQVLANGASTTAVTVPIMAVPMYNTTPDRAKFHTKGRGDGYVLTLGGKRIYIAGDTEATPEMLALKNIDVAFLPMNLPYTMTEEQAAAAVKAFKPKVVYPYHYRGSDTQKFKDRVGGAAEVRLVDWYKNAAS
jgi:L-ascorbate metabolism protein UlaG (beta-lactamase superfamily)